MNKKFYGTLLLGTLLLGSTIVSCKDYDDDIDNLQNQITQLATKADMQSEVSKLQSAVATAQAAAENKAAAAEQAAKDAAAKAQAAADAAAKAQGTADAAATVEALNKVAAEAAAAAQAAADAKTAAEAKAAELEAQLAELQALAATLVSTKDFEAAKKELNDKYAELAAKIGETTGTTGLTGLQVLSEEIKVGYGIWAGVHKGAATAEWDGPKKDEVAKLAKGDYVSAFGAKNIQIAVNPTDVDVTNTEFAVVNQYGEIAPIAFGTPEVLTRANAAGTYKVKIASAALTSDVVKEFGENFETGTSSTLVAGKIASTLKKNFVTVSKNENGSYGTFGATVKFDQISGSVEVDATDSEKVYDSYITGLKNVSKHDSLVWDLKYDGMTLTYNAEAAKKFANTDHTFTVKVKQINLNGYIHETDATVTFKAKEVATDKVEVEGNVTARTHDVQLREKHPTTDAYMQVETITKAKILEALNIQAGTEAAIHFDHVNTNWTATAGKAFFYTADNDTMCLQTVVEKAEILEDDNSKFTGVKIRFKKDYPVDNFKHNTAGDFLTNGETLYIPVVLTGTDDEDLGDPTEYTYTVNVPVKFEMPATTDLFAWKDVAKTFRNSDGTAKTVARISTLATSTNATIDDEVAYAAVAPNYTLVEDSETDVESITPAVTVELDYQNMQSYKKVKAVLDKLEIGDNVPVNTSSITLPPVFSSTIKTALFADAAKVDKDNLEKAYKILVDLYKQKVVIPLYNLSGTDTRFVWHEKSRGWKTTFDPAKKKSDVETKYKSDGYKVLYNTENYSFKVKGMHISVLGRNIGIGDVTVNNVATGNAAADFTATLSSNKYINDNNAPVMKFFDANIGVADASKMKGSYSIIDNKFDLPLKLNGSTVATSSTTDEEFTIVKVIHVDADGIENNVTTKFSISGSGVNDKILLTTYKSVADNPATPSPTDESEYAWGLKIKPVKIADAKAGDKLVFVIKPTLERPYDGEKDAYAGKTVAFEFVIAE